MTVAIIACGRRPRRPSRCRTIGSTPPGIWIEPIGYGASTMFDGSLPRAERLLALDHRELGPL
jgi:hypothetical protein